MKIKGFKKNNTDWYILYKFANNLNQTKIYFDLKYTDWYKEYTGSLIKK